ncbi:acetyl-CoA synthetase-like protein, partial [Anaeromyces robustus]
MIGMFVSTQPILLKYDKPSKSFLDIIKMNMKILMELYNNQDISFSELINALKLKKVNNSFIFQPKSIIENSNSNGSVFLNEDVHKMYSLYEESNEFQLDNDNTTKFDIIFNVIERNEGYLLEIEYNKLKYNVETINDLMNSYIEVLNNINNFDKSIKSINYLPNNMKNEILYNFNNNWNDKESYGFYHEEFKRIAKINPDKVAIKFNKENITYNELDKITNSLSNYLRKIGIKRNDIIPIITERNPYYIIALLSVSKSGAAYLPIDIKLPTKRIEYILKEVNPKVILYDTVNIENMKIKIDIKYNYYNLRTHNYNNDINDIVNINKPEDICYILFTSGTTGKPKGVLINHFNIYNYVRSFDEENKECNNNLCIYNIFIKNHNIKNVLSITNFAFDSAQTEITFSLVHGLKIILADDNISSDIKLLSKYMIDNDVEFINTTPTRFKLFIENEEFKKSLNNLKIVYLGGEELTLDLYKYLNPIPIDVEGEIYISGYNVGQGYINKEELTKEVFISNPFKNGEMMYKTGDLGKWTRNGEIKYCGRIDLQVKIHGLRIELHEVENTIKEMEEIEYSVVIDRKHDNGDKYLVCYFISEKLINGKEIREYLKNKLPSYMIPNYFVKIDNIPITSNGKLDRKSLPEPNIKDLMKESYSPPINETEEKVCEIFSQIFNIHKNKVGRFNDFYEFGGDSFKAIQLCNLISKSFNIKVNIQDILSHPIISEFSEYIENKLNKEIGKENEIIDLIEIKKHNKKEFPITSQQMGVYIDSIKNPNSIIYNIPDMFQLNKSINIEIIKEGFQILFNKQEILRSKYSSKEVDSKTEIYGYIDDECSLIFEEYTYENAKTFVRPFDLSKAPLIRVGFIKNEVLLIDMHHIISDGITMTIIINEINKYYNGLSISELEVQFSDYAIHMNEVKNSKWYSKQIEFYKEMFKEDYEITNIPKKEREIVNEYEINKEEINEIGNCIKVIDNSISKNINEYIKTNSLSKTAFFISIYGYILSKYSGQEIIYTSMMSANRNNHYLENMIESEKGYLLVIEYNKNVYESSIIENIMNSCIEMIMNLDKFNENIQNIEYIPKEEKEKIITKFNDNDFIYDCDKLYHVEFNRVAKENPESIALIYNNTKYKYRELDEMSNSLAHYLREHGIGRNDIIPIICERAPYYIIGTLAISKAGGAFLPIDPKYPLERIKYILDDVKPSIILTYNVDEIMKYLKQDHDYNVYKINNHDYEKNRMMLENINSSDDTCYVLFTSGTTGKPKGAMVSHFNIYNFIRKYDDDKDRINMYNTIIRNNGVNNMMAIANFPFDLSHIEITFSLIHGLTIVFADEEMLENISDMGNYIKENQIEFITTTPTRFKLFMENEEFKNQLKQIKVLIFIGESLPLSLCKEIHKYSECKIYNSYGPTECSVTCTLKEIDTEKEEKISIGKPMTNCKVYILDKYKKPVPIGVVGYIYIGGFGVGKGYLGRPELTKEMFIQCPFNNNSNGNVKEEYEKTSEIVNNNVNSHNTIMYNTGDLGKWNNNGEIEYLGRADFQVKIKGHRIELGEIENTIKEIQEIEQCAVIDRKNENEEITRNGKLDRKVLPEPDINDIIEEKYVKPVNKIEEKICEIYSQIFNIDINKIGRTSDFLELGGDSLQAIRVATFIEKEYKVKIYMKDVLSHSTTFDLGKFIDYKIKNDRENEEEIHIIKKYNQKEYPITSQQMGVYIDSIKNPNSTIYNIPRVLPLNKSIDIKKIKEGFNKLFNKQNILRSKYIEVEIDDKTEIHGYIDDECSLIFEEYTYGNAKTFVRPFDLSKAPLIRVGFIENEVLLIDMHHIISDGTTMSIIINEINKYYNGLSMSELEVQFSDYAIHMDEMKNSEWYSKQIELYKKLFKEEYEIARIPQNDKVIEYNENNEYKINENKESEIGNCDKYIDTLMSEKINEYIRINKISKTSFFLSIYGYILSKYSGQEIIYTSMMSANRNNHYLENMIGMFVSTQPILLKYDQSNKSFLDILKENMEIIMELYNNQDISFSELINTLKLKKVNNSFIFQPKDIFENSNIDNSIFPYEEIKKMYSLYEKSNEFQLDNDNITKFDITFNVIERNEGYLFEIEYNKLKYNVETINDLMNSYIEVLNNINNFDKSIKSINYLPNNMKNEILYNFNNNWNDKESYGFYHEEFKRIAKINPNKVAIKFNKEKITYNELDKITNSLSNYLRKIGIKRNDIIPIITERNPYYIIALLSVSKSGAAYLPIDIKLPTERIEYILKEVNPKVILYDTVNIENMKNEIDIKYNYYNLRTHNYNNDINDIVNINKPEDICYILFTSGTTGKPKGVLINHFNIYNYVRSFDEENKECNNNLCIYNIFIKNHNIKNVLSITNFAFDSAQTEITFSLVHGLKIILADDNISSDIKLLSKYMIDNDVEFINTTPTRFKLFIENEEFKKSLNDLKIVYLGGEELSLDLCKKIHKYSQCKIYNSYGPTECTVDCSIKEINEDNENEITIGKPICNCSIYILDKYLNPIPIDVEGEIYISGYNVGQGYINKEELTKEVFISNPFKNGEM